MEFETLTDALEQLRREGYTHDFNLQRDCLTCEGKMLYPHEFQIDRVYRFEGMTNPSDQSILYAISSHDHKLKGVLVNAYGVYADEMTNEMIEKLG